MTAPKLPRLRRDHVAARMRGEVPTAVRWPCDKWRWDILGFAREVLGVEWLSEDQQLFLLSFQDNTYTTVRGGRKSGKTRAAAIAAWWYVCTFEDARVVMTAPTENSVEEIIWRDVKELHARAKYALGGDLHLGPRTGWRDGTRAIYGRVARSAGGIRGLSGANVAYIADEASDIADEIWETIDGNLAGGQGEGRASRALLISNPTRLQGFFFNSHHRDERWQRIHMPAIARDDKPGMASSEWLAGLASYYSDSYIATHVRGEFPSVEESRIVSAQMLELAAGRWAEADAEGELVIGLDPATSERNDECAFAVRRGMRHLASVCYRGQSYESIAQLTCALAEEHRTDPTEPVRVVVDAQGPVGDGTTRALRDVAQRNRLVIVPLRQDDFARMPIHLTRSYADLNGARWGVFAAWLRDGGGVIAEQKLSDELLFPSWVEKESGKRGITRKDEFRDALGRSPDRADALINACWTASLAVQAAVPGWQQFNASQVARAEEGAHTRSHARDRSYNPHRQR